MTRGDPARAIELCSHVDDAGNRIACLSGAVQDRFWDTQSADEAIRFCKMLNVQEEKSQCYATVLDRAGDLFTAASDLDAFCLKLEPGYHHWCR